MAKIVTHNSGVAQSWVKQRNECAVSNNGNFSHEGRKLYSYSTCIAMLHDGTEDKLIALFTTSKYSVTTSGKHESPAYSHAAYAGMSIFSVPQFRLSQGHDLNIEYLKESVLDAINGIANAQVRRPIDTWFEKRPAYCLDKLTHYCNAFGLVVPKFGFQSLLNEAYGKWTDRRDEYTLPKNVEKRKRANARRMLIGLVNGKPVKTREEHWI